MADKQLGGEFKALLFSLFNAYKIVLVFLLILNFVNANYTCKDTQLTIDFGDGTFACEDCPRCPAGQGLSHKCGDHIDAQASLTCENCPPGKSYSSKDDISQCKECDSCMKGQEVVHPCDETSNAQCGKSCVDSNRYFDDERGCLNCSCCGDGNNTVEEECKRKLGAGSNMICSFNRSATGCEFITPSPQTVTTIIQDDTSKQNERINDSESTPSPETGVGITRDEFSKQPTSIYYQLEIRQIIDYKPSIIESVSISSLVLLGIVVATLVVATLVFLFRRGSMQRYCMRRMNTARDLDEDDGIPMEPIGSKYLRSLLEDEAALERICDVLDTRRNRCGNYWEVARHYGFDNYQIEARLERHLSGPSRALIEWLAARHPFLNVKTFARVVKDTARRNSVVRLLKEFDNNVSCSVNNINEM